MCALSTKTQDLYASKPPRKVSQISDLTITLLFMNLGEVLSSAGSRLTMANHGEQLRDLA